MRVLITGGAGFIGSHVVRYCTDELGWSVLALDRNALEKKGGYISDLVEWVDCDLRDKTSLENIVDFAKVDIVFHLAAKGSVRGNDLELMAGAWNNVVSTYNMLLMCIKHRIRKFVFASSGTAIYGDSGGRPIPEEAPLRPISHYGQSKLQCELLVDYFSRHTVMTSFYTLRLANVYGPGQLPKPGAGVIPAFIERIKFGLPPVIRGDGKQERDFVFVKDILPLASLIAEGKVPPDSIWNIGSGRGTSVRAIYNTLALILDEALPPPEFGPPSESYEVDKIVLDVTKARETLNWRAGTDLKSGLLETLDNTDLRTATKGEAAC